MSGTDNLPGGFTSVFGEILPFRRLRQRAIQGLKLADVVPCRPHYTCRYLLKVYIPTSL